MTESTGSLSSAETERLLKEDPEKLRQMQLQMVQDWVSDRTGRHLPGAARIILERLNKPMTQEDYLVWDGLGGLDLDEVLEDEEMLDSLPEWFQDLPRGRSRGLY